MEPVDPTIDIGLGPSQFLGPGSTSAVPGHAGGRAGGAEHRTDFPIGSFASFLLTENPPWSLKCCVCDLHVSEKFKSLV